MHYLYAQVIGSQLASKPTGIYSKSFGEHQKAAPQILYQEEKATDQDTMPPSYNSAADVPWLEESLVTWRSMTFNYFPDTTGSTVSLDDSYTAFVDGLGVVETRCGAKIVSLAML